MLHLVNDLLDYSKIEAGLFQFHQEPFKLREVIEHVHSMLKVKAQEKGISIRYHIDESIPEQVMGDSKRLNQILLNLISNGIKFTSQGEVTTTVKVAKESPYTLQFFVKDTGIGIPSHRTEAVFERYHQAASDTSHHYGGPGGPVALLVTGNLTWVNPPGTTTAWLRAAAGVMAPLLE